MSDPAAFFTDVYGDARIASSQTGVPISVVLAQWADETGYGSSAAFTSGHNYAGVSPSGHPASYPDRAAGLAAYIRTLLLPNYAAVRSAADPTAAAVALGQSPWAGGHYNASGKGPGADLLAIMQTNDLTRYDAAGASTPATSSSGASAQTVSWWNPTTWFGGVGGAIQKLVATGVFIVGGLALVVAGGWRSVAPAVRPVIDKAKGAARVAAIA